jgi:hypothetical protein
VAPLLEPHQGVPAQGRDGLEQLLGLQAAVAQDQHLPALPQRLAQQAEQAPPVVVPTPPLVAPLYLPGHRHGAAAVDHAGGEDDEAVAQVGGVDGQGQAAVAEAGGGPPQQRPEAGGVGEGVVAAARAGRGPVELAEALADGVEGGAQGEGEPEHDGVEQGGLRQGDAVAGQGQPGAACRRQVGEEGSDTLLPVVECLGVGHGNTPRPKSLCNFNLRMSHAPRYLPRHANRSPKVPL